MKTLALFLATVALAACSDPGPVAMTPASSPAVAVASVDEREVAGTSVGAEATPAASPVSADGAIMEAEYLGRWTGVEGMYLVVAPKPGGGVTLEMQWDLDNAGTFDGAVTAEGLRFMRNGVAESALRTNGDATGLKYLAGKTECLTVKQGEGYCRD